MGIFDKLFNLNNNVEETIEEPHRDPIVVIKETDEIINILGLLGILDINKIKNQFTNDKNFNDSILNRIMIKVDNDSIDYLTKYLANTKLGYGEIKLNQIRNRLNEIANDAIKEEKNREEVIEELVQFARIQVENYERVLKSLNETLKKLDENKQSEADFFAMMEYWLNYYKEQDLGYPIDLASKIGTMALELRQLPYGGYGDREIKMFIDAANKMAEEAKNNNEETNHTMNRIKTSLFDPKKSRYMSDVETLKRKFQMIADSPYLSDIEKEQNKQQIIREFNQMNGHELDLQSAIDQMKKNLTLLEYGGFGEIVIERFKDKSTNITLTGKEEKLDNETILNRIKEEYNKLIVEYQTRLSKLKDKIRKVHEENISTEEKQRKEEELIEDFQDELGHPIDYKSRVDKMYQSLKIIGEEGYGETRLSEFMNNALKLIETITTPAEGAKVMREIRKQYYKLIDEYNDSKALIDRQKQEIEANQDLSISEKKAKLENLDRQFAIQIGKELDFNDLVASLEESLKTLGKVGYGENTLAEFRRKCKELTEHNSNQKDVYQQINQLYSNLKDRYMVNQNTFNEWKFLQLKNLKGEEKEQLAKELDEKIAHMLSLSPSELNDYFLEDDREKREERNKHNYRIAYRFLAKQESKKKKDKNLYDKRMKDFESGNPAYTQDEIEAATTKIERIELTSDDIPKEDRLISIIDYIDSTLLRQILYVEAATSKKKYINKYN